MTSTTDQTLQIIQQAVRRTKYEGKLYLVGGFVRDQVMGLPSAQDDIDIVLEGDALAVAQLLCERKVTDHAPVVYPRFGTAMVAIHGRDVELVTARIESYTPDSRKPEMVQPGTLQDDAKRRDFTINTLLQSLETRQIIDPLGSARHDIAAKIIRTPTEPLLTFQDDPLRMLRAIRFAARFGFTIEPKTWEAIVEAASRLQIISAERIRDEFCKTLLTTRPTLGLELLRESGLLAQFAPELLEMVDVTQNSFHSLPVWEHSLKALESLPRDATLTLRLATLLHDIGKPRTRTVDAEGHVHFYQHQTVGAEMARLLLNRLKFSNSEILAITQLVAQHMRIGEYQAIWSDSAVRRLIRDLGHELDDLFTLHRADVAGLSPDHQDISHSHELRERIDAIQTQQDIRTLQSPLDGAAIMSLLNLTSGKRIGEIKAYLTNEVVEGRLASDDAAGAEQLVKSLFGEE